jgi:hypothetical protein
MFFQLAEISARGPCEFVASVARDLTFGFGLGLQRWSQHGRWPRAVRKRISRSLEKFAKRPFSNAETLGWPIPMIFPPAIYVKSRSLTIFQMRRASLAFASSFSRCAKSGDMKNLGKLPSTSAKGAVVAQQVDDEGFAHLRRDTLDHTMCAARRACRPGKRAETVATVAARALTTSQSSRQVLRPRA